MHESHDECQVADLLRFRCKPARDTRGREAAAPELPDVEALIGALDVDPLRVIELARTMTESLTDSQSRMRLGAQFP